MIHVISINMASFVTKSLIGLNITVIFVFFLLLTSNHEIAVSIRSYSTGDKPFPDVKRTNVVIVSQGRGGSTFLGEIFNNNPDVFYVFEPLFLAGSLLNLNVFYERETQKYSQTCLDILHSFFGCNFANQTKVLDGVSAHRGLRAKSRVLSSSELCFDGYEKLEKAPKRKRCQRLSSKSVNHVCKEKKHTAVKVLVNRLPNKSMASLKWLLTGNYDIRILHLVRDPRPVVYSWVRNSWIKGTEDPKLVDNIHRICDPIYENMIFAESHASWLQGRYKLVHYEELAVKPLKVAREIYDFLGFSWAREVEKWINLTGIAAMKRSSKNPYSTLRNGSAEVTRWESEMPKDLIRIVEDVCGKLIAIAGYKNKMDPKRLYSNYGDHHIRTRTRLNLNFQKPFV